MSALEIIGIIAAGIGAGAINTMVGSGSLVSFPILVALGYSPLVANVVNTVGLVPGSVTGAVGYRQELRGQRGRMIRFGTASLLGAIIGALLLLALPQEVFRAVVPVIIAIAIVLVLIQPALKRRLERRRGAGPAVETTAGRVATTAGVFGSGIYGGYFSAAQGILLLAVLGLGLPEDLQRVNALKNVLQMIVNIVAAVMFVIMFDQISWPAIGLMALGALAGGFLGAKLGRILPDWLLRTVIVVVGVAAIIMLAR